MTVFQNWISLVENAKKMDLARGEWLFMMSPDGAKYSRFGLWEPLGASGDSLVKSGQASGGFGEPRWSPDGPRWRQDGAKMAQDEAKMAQDEAKMIQDGAQTSPEERRKQNKKKTIHPNSR